jgi:hypothetical protein
MARGFGNCFATFRGLWASAHAAVIFATPVSQRLCLARLTGASGIRFTSVLIFHKATSRLSNRAIFWNDDRHSHAIKEFHLDFAAPNDTRSEEA